MELSLGARLRKLRLLKQVTIEELAHQLNLGTSIISMYERDERVPPLDKLILFSQYYGISLDELVGLHPNTSDSPLARQDLEVFTRIRRLLNDDDWDDILAIFRAKYERRKNKPD